MRARDLDRLAVTRYDVLVVGGGIHGLAIAYEAASRGLRTALVEAGDFGGGTSFNHQKTAHGGLRSLQTGRLDRARFAIRERRALARIAPWLLRPLPFLIGTYRSLMKNRLALRTAFAIDSWLARDRNEGIEPELHLPAPRLVSKAATLRLFPGIRRERLTGGAQWYDYQMVESDRLTLAFAVAADRAGADLVNYAAAVAPIKEGDRITGMAARDAFTSRDVPIAARAVVNAAGARAGQLMKAFGVGRRYPLLKAMNLVTSRSARDMALAAPAMDGRMLTLVPWRGRAIVGTSQSSATVGPDDGTAVTAGEVDAFIAQANEAFPALALRRADVTLVHRGIVPAVEGRDGRPELLARADILDHTRDGAPGAFTVVGVKYTTARGVAQHVVDVVARALQAHVRPSRTADTPLPGAAIADHEALAIEAARAHHVEVDPRTIAHLIQVYAEGAAEIVGLIAHHPELQAAVAANRETIGAEIVHAIQAEMAVTLPDIVVRRTGLGAAGHPGAEAVQSTANLAAAELGWDGERVAQEVAAVDRFYEIN